MCVCVCVFTIIMFICFFCTYYLRSDSISAWRMPLFPSTISPGPGTCLQRHACVGCLGLGTVTGSDPPKPLLVKRKSGLGSGVDAQGSSSTRWRWGLARLAMGFWGWTFLCSPRCYCSAPIPTVWASEHLHPFGEGSAPATPRPVMRGPRAQTGTYKVQFCHVLLTFTHFCKIFATGFRSWVHWRKGRLCLGHRRGSGGRAPTIVSERQGFYLKKYNLFFWQGWNIDLLGDTYFLHLFTSFYTVHSSIRRSHFTENYWSNHYHHPADVDVRCLQRNLGGPVVSISQVLRIWPFESLTNTTVARPAVAIAAVVGISCGSGVHWPTSMRGDWSWTHVESSLMILNVCMQWQHFVWTPQLHRPTAQTSSPS